MKNFFYLVIMAFSLHLNFVFADTFIISGQAARTIDICTHSPHCWYAEGVSYCKIKIDKKYYVNNPRKINGLAAKSLLKLVTQCDKEAKRQRALGYAAKLYGEVGITCQNQKDGVVCELEIDQIWGLKSL